MITWLRITIGAAVEKYSRLTFAISLCQRSLPGGGVEGDEVVVRGQEVEPVAVHAHAAVADVDAAPRAPVEVPELAAGARVHRPHVVGRGQVEHPVDEEGRGLDVHPEAAARAGWGSLRSLAPGDGALRGGVDAIDPREREALDVARVDLARACCSGGRSSRRDRSARRPSAASRAARDRGRSPRAGRRRERSPARRRPPRRG